MNKLKLVRQGFSVITVLSILSSCNSPLKSADKAATNSEVAAQTSVAIKCYNHQTMEAMKMGAALETREREFDAALAEEGFDLKTKYTSPYFQAMSFQLIGVMKENCIDVEKTREAQKADSVKEFVKHMSKIVPSKFYKTKPTALDKSNEMQTLYAFAATMHELNQSQVNNLANRKESYLKIITFYDVVTSSLALRDADRKGLIARSALTATDKNVLRETEMLTYIMKVRYMILPVIALARMSNIQDGIAEKLDMRYTDWTVKEMGTEEINYINDILDRAKTTKEFLKSIGEVVDLDDNIKKIYSNLKLNQEFVAENAENGSEKVKAISGLKERLAEF